MRQTEILLILLLCIGQSITEHNYRLSYDFYDDRRPVVIINRVRLPVVSMVDITNHFAFKTLSYHSIGNQNNIAFSPCELGSVLIAVYEGCYGRSAFEIYRAMELPWDVEIIRVGYRDIHRRLRSYFYQQENIFSGLSLSRDSITIRIKYEQVLRFYGYNLDTGIIVLKDNSTPKTTTIMPPQNKDVGTEMDQPSDMPAEQPEDVTNAVQSNTEPGTTELSPKDMVEIITMPPQTTTSEASATTVVAEASPPETAPETTTAAGKNEPDTTPAPTTTSMPEAEAPPEITTPVAETPSPTTTAASIPEESTTPSTMPDETPEQQKATTTNSPETTTSQTVTTTIVSEIETTPMDTMTETMPPQDQTQTTTANTDTTTQPNDVSTIPSEELRMSRIFRIRPFVKPNKSTLSFIPEAKSGKKSKRSTGYTEDYNENVQFIPQDFDQMLDEHNHIFYLNPTESIQAPFKTYNTILRFAYIDVLQSSVLELPLDSEDYNLLLIMPNKPYGLESLVKAMATDGAPSLRNIREKLKPQWIQAMVPKFNLEGNIVLTADLMKMGITDIFEPNRADFSPMTTESGIYAKHIEQSISVNIRTYANNNLRRYAEFIHYEPIQVAANQPFMFAIVDNELDLALMIGQVMNPLNTRIL